MDYARRAGGSRGPFATLLRILFGALLALSFFLFVLWRTENPRLTALRLALVDWATPVLEVFAGPSSGLGDIFDDVQSLTELRAENARLQAEIQRLRRWENDARRLEQENAQLRALNAVSLPPQLSAVTGEVVADSGGVYSQSVIVNVGRRDGVRDGAAAQDALGVAGRVVGAGERSARVLLLTDPSSRAPVHVYLGGAAEADLADGRRRRAILTGDNSLNPVLRYVDGDGAVPSGARVATSGEGGVFPKGMLVGEVVARGDDVARVALAADLRNLDFLRILRSVGQGPDTGQSGLILRAAEQGDADPLSDGLGADPTAVDDAVGAGTSEGARP
ncbi:MAG: rod shape-determining protein MreC [Pseudomonadota bacterium]